MFFERAIAASLSTSLFRMSLFTCLQIENRANLESGHCFIFIASDTMWIPLHAFACAVLTADVSRTYEERGSDACSWKTPTVQRRAQSPQPQPTTMLVAADASIAHIDTNPPRARLQREAKKRVKFDRRPEMRR